MNHIFSQNSYSSFIRSFFLFVVFVFCFTSKIGYAIEIEPYDFDQITSQVTKSWNPAVALHVAKKCAIENGFDEKAVSIQKLNAGASNHFIYLVLINNEMKFVLKGLSTKKEAEALLTLQNSTILHETQNNPAAAKITFSKRVHYYQENHNKNQYYFALLEAAQGKELFKTMTTELLQNKNINRLKDIFFRIGQQIGELHKNIVGSDKFISPKNLVSVIHDDLHPENTFYDIKTNSFAIIDNESIGETITSPLPLIRELYGFYEIPIIRWPSEKVTIDLLRDADPHDIASIYYEFVIGMASVYQDRTAAKKAFLNEIILINKMAIAFLNNRYSEAWMMSPQDKRESHIVWGKFSRIYDAKQIQQYISKLKSINEDLSALAR